MKKIFAICVAIFATITVTAQQQLATLNHNDTLSAYYGPTALQQAHAAASNGDKIILSSGTFSSVDITKSVFIRGNGMEEDTIAGTTPTIISGDFHISVLDSIHQLKIEGVCMPSIVTRGTLFHPQFIKCRFRVFLCDYNHQFEVMTNATFVNCYLEQTVNNYRPENSVNTMYVNCVINNHNECGSQVQLFNCILLSPALYDLCRIGSFTCTNSIVTNQGASVENVSTSSFFNCIGIVHCDNPTGHYFADTNHNNVNICCQDSVFEWYRWNGMYEAYYDGINFELTNEIISRIHGSDGTQVGIYGGMVPYTPRVNTPRFVRSNVAPHTTLDGKLSVDIEVVAE